MGGDDEAVEIPVDGTVLSGELAVPPGATDLAVFAHGSGSSRHSPRNTFVAHRLRERGLGTLLFDLLTEAEDRRYETRFDVSSHLFEEPGKLSEVAEVAADWFVAHISE